jgi:hypothetical protein
VAKRLLQFFAFSIAAFMIGGCVTPLYKEPQSGPRAKVRFALVSRQDGASNIYAYPGGTPCKDGRIIGGLLIGKGVVGKKHKSLGIPVTPATRVGKKAYTEVYVPAGKRLPLEMDWNDGGYPYYTYCNVTTSFVPRDGGMYDVLNMVRGNKCGIAVFDIVRDGTGKVVTRKDPSQRKERQCGS